MSETITFEGLELPVLERNPVVNDYVIYNDMLCKVGSVVEDRYSVILHRQKGLPHGLKDRMVSFSYIKIVDMSEI